MCVWAGFWELEYTNLPKVALIMQVQDYDKIMKKQ